MELPTVHVVSILYSTFFYQGLALANIYEFCDRHELFACLFVKSLLLCQKLIDNSLAPEIKQALKI